MFQYLKPLGCDGLKDFMLNESDEAFNALFELSTINSFLTSVRRMWLPTSGVGSQSKNYACHIMLADKVQEIAKEKLSSDEV